MLETRLATFEDLHAIFLLVEKNYCENKALNQFEFADEKVYVIIKNLIEKQNIIVLLKDNKIIGGTGYLFVEHLFSYDKYMAEIMFFIEKKDRNLESFRILYKALEKAWLESEVRELHVGSANGYQNDRIAKLYQFFGHEKFATTLKKVRS